MKPQELIERGRFLGEEFILWVWWRGLGEGGSSGDPGDTSACFVDDSVQLVNERGEVKELSLRKGNPAESREAFEALSRGMRPARAKLRILSGDLEWTLTLHAESLLAAALKLPPSQSKDPAGRAGDRLFLLEEGLGHLERRFQSFTRQRVADPGGMEKALRAWLQAGLQGLSLDEAPWEA